MKENYIKLSWEDPPETVCLPTPILLPREFHGQKSLAGYIVHGVAKSWTRLRARGRIKQNSYVYPISKYFALFGCYFFLTT